MPPLRVFVLAVPGLLAAQPTFYAPRPKPLPAFEAPNRPLLRLAEWKSAHATAPRREIAFRDQHLQGEIVVARPGERVAPRFHPDTRIYWVVFEGQVRFDIEGQQPFTAKAGALVQVPKQRIYTMETTGEAPSLRLEVTTPNATTVFVRKDDAGAAAGREVLDVRPTLRQPEAYKNGNRMHVNIHELLRDPSYGDEFFVDADNTIAHIVCAYEKDRPPATPGDRGHYHAEGAEVFVNLTGRMRMSLEGEAPFTATAGDILYVPRYRFHNAGPLGQERSCRLVLSAYREPLLQFRDPLPSGAPPAR